VGPQERERREGTGWRGIKGKGVGEREGKKERIKELEKNGVREGA